MTNSFLSVVKKPVHAIIEAVRQRRARKDAERLVDGISQRLQRPATFGDVLLETEPRHSDADFIVKRARVTQAEEERLNLQLMTALDSHSPFSRIKQLLEEGADASKADIGGRTPLMKAVYKYHGKGLDIFNLLKANGASLDAVDNEGWNAFMWATYASHESACKWLYENRSSDFDVNARDKGGKTALDIAYEHKSGVQDYLISIGCKCATASH